MIRRLLGLAWMVAGAAWLVLISLAWTRATLRSPAPSVMLEDRHGTYLGEVNVPEDGRLGFWPATGDTHRIVAATKAIEDRRFEHHAGVDPTAVLRAIQQNLTHGERISGASTLAMQVARLQNPGARTYSRKVLEAVTALFLVDRHGRDAVLAQYLQLAPYGNNVHGVRYAARRYFDKPLADLTWAESSFLAALPQAPGQMNPYTRNGRRRGEARASRILDRLLKDGQLTPTEHAAAQQELPRLAFGIRPRRPEATLHPVLAMDGSTSVAPELRTTLDLPLQEHVEQILLHQVLDWRSRGAGQAAAMVIDRETMTVRAAVGSIGFHGTEAGAIDFTRVPRTPGSTLKPFLYGLALDRGTLRPDTVLDDLSHGPEGIRNADNRFLGPLLPRQALANSRNVPTVALAETVGIEDVFAYWQDLGLHDGSKSVDHYGLGVAIGGMPVRLLDLAAAYGALANDGLLRPVSFTDTPREGRQVMAPETARLVTQWLSDPIARLPSFPRAGFSEYPFAVAVKTGTSPDFRDSWAVGYSETTLVLVWVGHPDWRPMKRLSGYSGANSLLHRILMHTDAEQADGLVHTALAPPEGWTETEVCALSGHKATPLCHAPRLEWFAPGESPVHDCTTHTRHEGRVVIDLPNRYAPWLATTGLPAAPTMHSETIALAVVSPADGTRVVRDPDVPADRSTLRLQASVDPPTEQVVWYVDGQPFAVVDYPYVARWPVQPGKHTFEARLALRDERSASVQIEAR